jgi:hypothetical protein
MPLAGPLYVVQTPIPHAFVVPTLRKMREEWGTHCVIDSSETKAWAHRLWETVDGGDVR